MWRDLQQTMTGKEGSVGEGGQCFAQNFTLPASNGLQPLQLWECFLPQAPQGKGN